MRTGTNICNLDIHQAVGWRIPNGQNWFRDLIRMASVRATVFEDGKRGEFSRSIRNDGVAFRVDDHTWWSAVDAKGVKREELQQTRNTWEGVFKDVKTGSGWGGRFITSFKVETTYTINLLIN